MINAAERDSAASGNCNSSDVESTCRARRLPGVVVTPRAEIAPSDGAAQTIQTAIEQRPRLLAGRTLPGKKGRWCLIPVAHRTRTPDRTRRANGPI